MLWIILAVGALTLIYLVAIKPFNYWKNKNVPTGKVTPVFGDNLYMFLGREAITDMIQRMYNKLSDVRYIGCYGFGMPMLLLKSPDLIKQMCVKDFDHFLDHRNFFPDDGEDQLWSKNLISLKGQAWKTMRSTLSPSFTSSKMKGIFVLVCHNANLFVQHFMEKDDDILEIEFKDAYTRYTNDVIASAAFGIQVDSFKEKENEFYLMGREATDFNAPWKKFILLLNSMSPIVTKFLKLSIFEKKMTTFFANLVKDTIKMREEQNIKRPDMLGLLMEARKGQQKEKLEDEIEDASFSAVKEHLELKSAKQDLSEYDIASQVFTFLIGGFETVSSAMCFMAHELAANPDVQKKLFEEIEENKPQNGAPSYQTILNMTYLDMVVSETLRKWPVNLATDRVVTKPYTIQPEYPDESIVDLEVGVNVFIPIYAIHHDPKYYENPEKFDPDRFSSENRKNIDPYTYLPFGVGPRNCVGSRFALLEIKAVFFYLLSHFEIVPVEKTDIPLKMCKSAITMTSENGFILGLKRRV